MADILTRHWWSLAARGLLAILFGVLAFAAPGAAIAGMAIAFGAFALVTGIFAIVFAIQARRSEERWGTVLFEGIISLIVGVFVLMRPGIAAVAFVTLVAVWSILTGGAQIATAIRLRKIIEHEWLLGIAGVFSIAFGALLLYAPVAGAIVLAWWIGAYAFVLGLLQIGVALKLRRWSKKVHATIDAYRAA
jgi:uncharacterized membrane protein HdeD (DUF308 family)